VQMGLLVGLCVVLLFGGNVIDHFLLRLIFWGKGCLPLKLAGFLHYAADLGLIRRVGGGYLFTNRILQEYYTTYHEFGR